MNLPRITAKVLTETIDNLWEDGAEYNRDVEAGVFGEVGSVERGESVMELNNLARYIDYLTKYDRCRQGLCCHVECQGF